MEKLKRIRWHNILLLLLLLFIYWFWWLPGVRVANDYPLINSSTLLNYLDIPRLWHELGSVGLGEFGTFIFWSYPQSLLSGILAHLNISFSFQERLIYVIPIIIFGILGVNRLLARYELSKLAVFVSSVFYLTTTYLLLLVDGGQLSIALVYSLFPWVFVLLERSLQGILKDRLLALLLVSLVTFLDVRLLFLLLVIFLIRFVFDLSKNKTIALKSYFATGLVLTLGWLLINLFWLLPVFKFPLSSSLVSSLTQNIGIQPTTWKHAFLLLQPQWYKNVFGVIPPVDYVFVGIPALAFFAFVLLVFNKLLKKKEFKPGRKIVFWTALALVGIFLTKGSNPPFGFVYDFLFAHIPGFSLFRDSTKFFFLVSLSYAVLIAFGVDWLVKIGNQYSKWKFLKITPILFVVYLLYLVNPVYLGKMTGTFSKPVYENESSAVSKIIENDKNFSRIFFIPSRAPLGYSSPVHPSIEALRLVSSRPFAVGVVGNYEKFNFLREAPYMGELFSVAGIKYIYYPYPDTRRETLKQDNIDYYYAFSSQLENLKWIDGKISDAPVSVFKTKETKDHIFLSDNSFYIVGSDRIYWNLMSIDGFDLSKNALIFAEEKPMVIRSLDETSKIIVYDKNDTDLSLTFVDKGSMYFPAYYLGREPSENVGSEIEGMAGRYSGEGWWKRETSDLIWWRDFLQSKYGIDNLDFDYGGGWVVAEGETVYQIPHGTYQEGKNLFVRVMKSNRSGKIEFWQKKEKIGEVVTQFRDPKIVEVKLAGGKDTPEQIFEYKKADLNWYEVGKLKSTDPIIIKTFGDINVVNAMTYISDDEYAEMENKATSLKNEKRVIYWDQLTDFQKKDIVSSGQSTASLTFTQLDPTKYEITISGIDKPAYLVFSETFDELWQLNGQASKPVYSLLNGFYVDKPGNYTLYFTPQKYILPGLIVSGISLASILGILVVIRIKRKKNES